MFDVDVVGDDAGDPVGDEEDIAVGERGVDRVAELQVFQTRNAGTVKLPITVYKITIYLYQIAKLPSANLPCPYFKIIKVNLFISTVMPCSL